jgi:uncharacterized protein (TIGR03435 family)
MSKLLRNTAGRAAILVAVFCAGPTRSAQTASVSGISPPSNTIDRPTFEAASVKVNKAGGPFQLFFQPGGRFRATNVTLKMLIGAAYGTPQPLPDFQLEGGPKWMDSDRFDVIAKAAGDPQPGPNGPPPEMFLMIRSMLEERFHLKVHYETKEMPIYALVMARSDGKLGPRMTLSATDCAARMAALRGRGGPPPTPPAPGERPPCGARMFPGNVSAGAMTMTQIVNGLARLPGVNRTVVDRTGLTGVYDLDLTFTPDQVPKGRGDTPPGAPPLPPIDPNGPSLFTALQEQLGLKLEPARAPVNVLVIDRAEQPTDD